MGIVRVFSETGAKPVLLKRYRCLNRYFKKKKKHKTTIDNDDIKNFFGHIPCKSRSHGALTEKRSLDCRAQKLKDG